MTPERRLPSGWRLMSSPSQPTEWNKERRAIKWGPLPPGSHTNPYAPGGPFSAQVCNLRKGGNPHPISLARAIWEQQTEWEPSEPFDEGFFHKLWLWLKNAFNQLSF